MQQPEDFGYYGQLLALPEVRKSIHVGNLTYNDGSEVEKHLINDIMDTVKPNVTVLMDNYKVKTIFFWGSKTGFPFQNNPKILDLSYKTELEFWDG